MSLDKEMSKLIESIRDLNDETSKLIKAKRELNSLMKERLYKNDKFGNVTVIHETKVAAEETSSEERERIRIWNTFCHSEHLKKISNSNA